ncbi:MAG: hypothetical protein JWN36_1422, partial [Microbacteriaceae bacterium]|nr:hypothetical protein [Microbacteriaceae bacterium]
VADRRRKLDHGRIEPDCRGNVIVVANAEGTTPGAGWFADPAGSPYLRWWDGSQWTDNFIDAKTGAPPGELPAAPSAPAASTTPEVVAQEAEPEPVVAQPLAAEPVADAASPATPEPTPVATPAASTDSAFAPGSPFAPVIPGAYVPAAAVAPTPDLVQEPAGPEAATPEPAASEPAVPEPSAPEPVSFDPGPSFPEQTSPVGPQLTRRQARIMQEMEEARNSGAVVGGEEAEAPEVPAASPFVVPPVVQPPVVPAAEQPPVPQPVIQQPVVPQPVVPPVVPAAELPVQTPIVPPPTPAPAVQPQAAQEPVVVPLPTPPTPFDASTVAPPTVTTAPTAWPFAAAPDATTAVPTAATAAGAGAAASATPWLNAPAPSPDAVLPVEKPAYEPMARPRSQSGTAQEVYVGTTNNWAIWVFAALPILHLAIIWYIYTSLQPSFDSPIRWGVLLGPIVFYILLAAVDLSILKRNGHVNLPSVLLAIIPLLYLGIRSARLGVRTLPPLIVWVVLQAGAVIALMFVFPTIYSQLTSASDPTSTVVAPAVATQSLTTAQRAAELTPSGMAGEITKELGAKGVTLKSVTCPPLQSTQDAVTVTCVGSVDDGTSLNIVVAVDSNNKTSAFDIVSSGPAS